MRMRRSEEDEEDEEENAQEDIDINLDDGSVIGNFPE